MTKALILSLALCSVAISGCAFTTAVPSQAGKAWVAKNTPFGGSFWHCDATAGDPVCTQVSNAPAGGQ
jgi:hypothetical protein